MYEKGDYNCIQKVQTIKITFLCCNYVVCHLRLTHTLIRVVHDSQKAFLILIRVQQRVMRPNLAKQRITQVMHDTSLRNLKL